MIAFKRKRVRDYRHPFKRYQFYGMIGGLAALLLIVVIVLVVNGNTNRRLYESRELMATSIRNDMNIALRSFDGIDLRSADLTGDILPTMREHLYAADAMNRVLVAMFGDNYSVLDREMYAEFEAVMAEYDRLLAAGQSTDSAKAPLTTLMTQVQDVLALRFGEDGMLLPKTAMRSTTAP